MDERRKNDRYPVNKYLGVYDQKTGDLLGCLVDLHGKGIQILGKEEFRAGSVYKIRLDLHKQIKDSKRLYFEAKNTWCKSHKGCTLFAAGFEFQNVDQETKECIALLLGSSAFRKILAKQG